MEFSNLKKILPFLDDEDLKVLVDKIKESDEEEYKGINIGSILPFLNNQLVYELFEDALAKNKDLHVFYPFLEDEYHLKIVEEMLEKGLINQNFYSFLPFLNEESLSKIVDYYLAKKVDVDVNLLYPYLSERDIKRIFHSIIS